MWSIVRREIDGVGLERWFLKTLINVAIDGPQRIGPLSSIIGEPSTELVEIAYGIRRFKPKAGLYTALQAGESISSADHFQAMPFFENEFVMGGRFYFRGWRFMLYLGENGLAPNAQFLSTDGPAEKLPPPVYHIRKMNFTNGITRQRLSQVVDFNWGNAKV
jgi:hypothetical protein